MMKRTWTLMLVAVLALAVATPGCSKSEPAKPSDQAATQEEGTQATSTENPAEQQGRTTLPAPPAPDPDYVAPGTQAAMTRGIEWLRQAQLPDGGWPMAAGAEESNLGVTCVAAYALVSIGVSPDDPMIGDAVQYVLRFEQADGGIYDPKQALRNYTTSIGVMVLKAADAEKYKPQTDKALAFLRDLQWGEGQGLQPESADFGGAGYGAQQRPDLSNTAWFIEAMDKLGIDKDDPAMERAVIFVSRTQAGEAAKNYWVSDGSGGFIYSPHGGGESKAGEVSLPSGGKGLKAYGSMTYAGFLSLIYAGLARTDPRVQAAHEWMQKHWTVEVNPEVGKDGYFYYLMTMGKALRAWGSPSIVDEQGQEHPWRKELSAKLIAVQQENGAWVNADSERWYEGNPALATPFALVALNACQAKL